MEGVYVTWSLKRGKWRVVDIGENENIRDFLSSPEYQDKCLYKFPGSIYFTATYTPGKDKKERKRIAKLIRERLKKTREMERKRRKKESKKRTV